MPERSADATISLQEPNGRMFPAHVVATRRDGGGDAPLDIRITFEVIWDQYDRTVDIFGLFHCPPELRGPLSGGAFKAGKDVRIEARLHRALAERHFADPASGDVVSRLVTLSREDPDHPLLGTEAWFALYVTQEVALPPGMEGALRAGYKTQWSDAAVVDTG